MKDNQKELFVVVDKNDNILDYRTRYDCHHNKSLIHRAVDVAIFNDQNELLLQKRSQQKDLFPGYYTLSASGHVEKGEEYEQTAYRELQEELGISGIKLTKIGKELVETEHETEISVLFTGKYNGPFHVPADEVEYVKFFSPKEIQSIKNLTPTAQKSLKLLKIL